MQSLKPLATGWEKLQMILDSGASVSVVPLSVGREYYVVRGGAATASRVRAAIRPLGTLAADSLGINSYPYR